MSNAETNAAALTVASKGKSVIAALAGKLECDPTKLAGLLKKTVFATCRTDEEFMAMCMVANTYGLNPLLKQIYAFPGKNGAVMPIVGIDGWLKIMHEQADFDGIDFEETPEKCTCAIWRKGLAKPVKVTEWLDECKGATPAWQKWPRRMLRHKATIQCIRVAFGIAGIFDKDEAERVDEATEMAASAPLPVRRKKSVSAILEKKGEAQLETAAIDVDATTDAPETAQAATPDHVEDEELADIPW